MKEGTMTVSVSDPALPEFSEYGTLVTNEGKTPDTDNPAFRFWDQLGKIEEHANSIGIVQAFPQSPRICPLLEKHNETSETLIPIEDEIVVVCALSRKDSPDRPDLSTVKAVRVRRGEALVLRPGVWHYAPMVTEQKVNTFVIFKAETPDHDLIKEEGLEIMVRD